MTHHFQILANVEAVVLLRISHFESKGCLAAIITRVLERLRWELRDYDKCFPLSLYIYESLKLKVNTARMSIT